MIFNEEFININFDKILEDSCGGDSSRLPSNLFIEYTNYKLRYLLSSSKRWEEYKYIEKDLKPERRIHINGDVAHRYNNTGPNHKKLKKLIQEQRRDLDNFVIYIQKLYTLTLF